MAEGIARTYASGVRCALWPDVDCDAALAFAAANAGPAPVALLMIFAAATTDPLQLAAAIGRHFPGARHIACSTAGEIGPEGYAEDSIVIVSLPQAGFHVSTLTIENLSGIEFADIARRVGRFRQEHDNTPPEGFAGAEGFALSFIDGLSRREELFVSAIHEALEGMPLLGGSTGDDLEFQRTWCIADGRILSDCGVLALVSTKHRFTAFRHDNFEPTDVRLVVTDCDQETRTVRELNAAPAAREYAECIGVAATKLDSMSFASHPVVVKVGGEYYCRSIGHANEDNSLTFFCAVETGVVLTVSRSLHLVESARSAFRAVTEETGADFVLGFDCALRRLDAENRQLKRELSDVYREHGVIGFNTYGEQFGAMHLNQTFTGLAIGPRV
ncbi:MAG: FIST N-terminal domain-containing protein [Beijerinckiaceae bacterium]